jgi:hypothetical protein
MEVVGERDLVRFAQTSRSFNDYFHLSSLILLLLPS